MILVALSLGSNSRSLAASLFSPSPGFSQVELPCQPSLAVSFAFSRLWQIASPNRAHHRLFVLRHRNQLTLNAKNEPSESLTQYLPLPSSFNWDSSDFDLCSRSQVKAPHIKLSDLPYHQLTPNPYTSTMFSVPASVLTVPTVDYVSGC